MKKSDTTAIPSIRALAKLVDRSHVTVQKWVKDDRWPFSRTPPWKKSETPQILRWAAEELAKEGGPRGGDQSEGSELRREKLRQEIRKIRANADQAETALAQERGDLHDADACEEEAVRRATLYRNAIQNIPTQAVSLALSKGMPHEAAPEYQKQLEELLNGCLKHTATADARSATGNEAGAASASTA